MARSSILTLLERSQPRGHSILCFNGKHQITFVGKGSERICVDLCGSTVARAATLPAKLLEFVRAVGKNRKSRATQPLVPLLLFLKDGSPVKVRVVFDPDRINHCLIFEREPILSSPEQLNPLGLSSRETEVSFWLSQGKTNWEIGKILQISSRTVEKHLENVFRKLQIDNREMLLARVRQSCLPQ